MTKQRLVLLRSIIERFQVLAGNNQQVRRRLRIGVANNNASIVLIHHVGRGRARQDFAKEAIRLSHERIIPQSSEFKLWLVSAEQPEVELSTYLVHAAAASSSGVGNGEVTDSRTRSISAPTFFSLVSIFS